MNGMMDDQLGAAGHMYGMLKGQPCLVCRKPREDSYSGTSAGKAVAVIKTNVGLEVAMIVWLARACLLTGGGDVHGRTWNDLSTCIKGT
jgi:hypothetical protein